MPSSNNVPSVANPKTKEHRCKKPTVSYHSMNRKKLVDLCQKEGLDVTGNETELKHRHSYFITLYNSECDSEHPKPVKELLKEVKNREKAIKVCLIDLFYHPCFCLIVYVAHHWNCLFVNVMKRVKQLVQVQRRKANT